MTLDLLHRQLALLLMLDLTTLTNNAIRTLRILGLNTNYEEKNKIM